MRHVDLCVIGSGSGNSIIDERFADWSVALIDDGPRFGGTCLNAGCIPTKMFVHPADLARSAGEASRVDVDLELRQVRWTAMRERIFGRIDPIAVAGEQWRASANNVTLYRERGRFVGPRRIVVGDEEITARHVVLATGSRPVLPDVPGLRAAFEAGLAHTSDSVMRLESFPSSLLIWGSGVVAAEFAHVFSSLGSDVTVLARGTHFLRRSDHEISTRFTRRMQEQVDVVAEFTVTKIVAQDGSVEVHGHGIDGKPRVQVAEALLVAVGRTPNSDTVDAHHGGVAVDAAGFVRVDAQQRTTAPGVFALGDVCSPWMLKHVANREARTVAHNLLHPEKPMATDHRAVPYAVFSHPQVAGVGLTEAEARATGRDITVAVKPYADTAAGWAREDTTSAAKVIADRTTGELLGAHIIGPEAAVLLQPVVQAMVTGVDAPTMARAPFWIHPALSEVVENAVLALDLGELR